MSAFARKILSSVAGVLACLSCCIAKDRKSANDGDFIASAQQVSVMAIEPFIKEDAGPTKAFRISRSCTSSMKDSLTVKYKVQKAGWGAKPQSASPGKDYNPLPMVATIPGGADYVDIELTPYASDASEYNETVKIVLSGSREYKIGYAVAAITIEDLTPPVPPTIWVADRSAEAREGNLPPVGTGTERDPYDGSTAKRFDAVMAAIIETNDPNVGTRVKLGPGTLKTRGLYDLTNTGWSLKSGMQIVGSGKSGPSKTTLQLDLTGEKLPERYSSRVICNHPWGDSIFRCRISDLEVDCDTANRPPPLVSRFNGVTVHGDDIAIERVSVKGAYGHTEPAVANMLEAWSILCAGPRNADAYSNKIVDCDSVEFSPLSNYACGPYMAFGTSTPVNGKSKYRRNFGLIENCTVKDNPKWVGYSINSGILRNSTSVSCGFGVRVDTGLLENLLIEDNNFLDCRSHGLQFFIDGSFLSADIDQQPKIPWKNVYVVNNKFTIAPKPRRVPDWGSFGVLLQGAADSREGNNMQILGNDFTYLPGGVNTDGELCIVVDTPRLKNSIIRNNTSNRTAQHHKSSPSFRFGQNKFPAPVMYLE